MFKSTKEFIDYLNLLSEFSDLLEKTEMHNKQQANDKSKDNDSNCESKKNNKEEYETPECVSASTNFDTPSEKIRTADDYTRISQFIEKDNLDETYYVRKAVNGARISEETAVVFDNTDVDGITTPGLTDYDLALILLYRNRNNKDRYDTLINFLKTFND